MYNVDSLIYGKETDPLYISFVRRSGIHTMTNSHFHPYYEIYYQVAGERLYFVKDHSFQVQQGDLVFVGKNEIHKTMHSGCTFHERLVIHFNDQFIHKEHKPYMDLFLMPFLQNNPLVRLRDEEKSTIEYLLKKMLSEMKNEAAGFELMLAHSVVELLLTATRYLQTNKPEPFTITTLSHKNISEIVQYINQHYDEPLGLGFLSKKFYISTYYMSRKFKEVTGFSFTNYLNITRVKESQRLLSETELSVTEISSRVGYENFSHYGKIFKKITGVSPRNFRKMMKQKNDL